MDFIDRLAEVVEKGGMDVYAWALIPKLRGDVARYPEVTKSCVTKLLSSGKRPT
jgi:hypothetical protein